MDCLRALAPLLILLLAQQLSVAATDDSTTGASPQGHARIFIGGRACAASHSAIVVPDQATAQEQYAARELQHHLGLITGRTYTITTESQVGDRRGLFVGKTRFAINSGVKFDTLGLEGTYVKTVGPALILAGNQRGVLYATYSFLEDNLGCRWFTPDCATYPRHGTIRIGALDKRYLPPLEFRAGDYPVARNGAFSARLRLNGNNHRISAEQGGMKGVLSLAHTFSSLCPPEKYFKDHPEYFSLVGGKRQSGYAQLCLTNPDVLKIAIAGVRDWIKRYPDMKVFSVSQNDTAYYCECENCKKVAEEEGSQSGPMLRFVNAIADDIARDHPDVAIETLAYQYTRKPPKITKPRPNVIVCLCSIECCFIHPLANDDFNKTFTDDIKGWSKICKRLWIWDYVINYAHSICPFPNLEVLKPNANFFIANGVKGIYEESCYYTKGSELQELRNYVIAKTLWDPSYDTGRAINEFCDAYYGPASRPIRAYLNLIHSSVQQVPNLHVRIYTHPRQYVFPEVIQEATRLFDQAETAVANDPVLLHRVQVARLPIMYAQIVLSNSGQFAERDGKLVQPSATGISDLVDRFSKIAHEEGVTKVREGGADAELDAWLASVPRTDRELNIETLRNAKLQVQVLPQLGGRIFRMTYLPANREMMKVVGTPEALLPTEGGYEEYSEGTYRSPGWSESYTVTERTDHSLTLGAALRNGLYLTRTLALDPQQPLLKITSVLKNTSQQSVTASLRAHPEFAVTSTQKAHVVVYGPDGKIQTISLANPTDPNAEVNQWLNDGDMPNGKWVLVDEEAKLALVNEFAGAEVAQALLNRSGAQSRVNLELFGKETKLGPGQSVSLTQSYEITVP